MPVRLLRSSRIAVLIAGLAILLFFASALWRGSRALRESSNQVARESEIAFENAWLDRPPPDGFETMGTPAAFTDARAFQGRIYLCGPPGLFEYDAQGSLLRAFRVGREIPPAPLGVMAIAAGDAGKPSLMITTSGEGMLAFDGERFRQIRPTDAAYRMLTAVLPLDSGQVLLGTQKKGLLAYDGDRLKLLHPALTDVYVTALHGSEEDLWVGTLAHGVYHLYAGRMDRFGEEEGLPDSQITAIAGSEAATFVGTPLGIVEFDDGRFQRIVGPGVFAHSLIVRGEKIMAGTFDQGVMEIPLTTRTVRGTRLPVRPLPADDVRLVELDGRLCALGREGLYTEDPRGDGWKRVVAYEHGSFADRNVSALAADAAGRLWVGYFDRGLDIVETGGDHVTHVENEHVFCVNRIVQDTASQITAVATANGLVLFDSAGTERQVLGRTEGLVADHVTDVMIHSGGMVIATPAGITLLDGGGPRSLYAFHGLVNNHIYALGGTPDQLLVGTLGGLSILRGENVSVSFTTANSGLKHNWITAMVPVAEDWFVGTYGAGVLQLDGAGRWHAFPDATGAFEINPHAMLATAQRVYAGTLSRGLYVYDRSSFRWARVQNGLPSVNVTALAAHGGYIYIGTDNGLVRIAEESLPLR